MPRTAQKVQRESKVLVRPGKFLAFSQSLDSAALPAEEDYFVSDQHTEGMEGGGGGGSPVRMVSRPLRPDNNPHLSPSVPGRVGRQPAGSERWALHGLLGHPHPPAPAAWVRDISHSGGGLLDR